MQHRSLVAALLIGLAGVSPYAQKRQPRTSAAPRLEKAVPFRIGETLTYDVSWSSYITAGTAVATVKEKKPSFNSTAYYIVAEARPTPLLSKMYSLYYKLDTLLDAYTLLPQRGSVYTEEGKRHKFKVTQFDRSAQKATFEVQSATRVSSSLKTAAYAQDALSALYVLRAIPLKAGDRITMPICDDGSNFRMTVQVEGLDRIKTALGEVTAWRIAPTIVDEQGRPQGRALTVWITDDARRLPVKIQAQLPVGTFNVTLREAR